MAPRRTSPAKIMMAVSCLKAKQSEFTRSTLNMKICTHLTEEANLSGELLKEKNKIINVLNYFLDEWRK
jgi:hypothetical protein